MPEWTTFDQLREGDVFKLVDDSNFPLGQNAGVYAVRSLEPQIVESVRYGHQVHDFAPDKPVLVTKRGSDER